MNIKIKLIKNGKLPEYKTSGSAGADCFARIERDIIIKSGKSSTIPLGFAVEIPDGYEMQIRGRSGLASKSGIEGFTGTIDSDYRGEVSAILFNHSEKDFIVKNGDRIAQAVIAPVIKAHWSLTNVLSETERGENGFGSTGVSDDKEIEVSYPHKVEKFYEPFKKNDFEKVKRLIGQEVIIDESIQGKVKNIFPSKEIIPSYCVEIEVINGQTFCGMNFAVFSFFEAFQRVTICGHRFGKELEIE